MLTIAMISSADTIIISDSPTVVRNAEIREILRQDRTWTDENIKRNPYLFVQDQICKCNNLLERIETQNITLIRLQKKAKRKINEAKGTISRYETFLGKAKNAYKKAAETKVWPINIDGFNLEEEELLDRINDALERIDMAKKELKDNTAIERKVGIRLGMLKMRKRETESLRRKLSQQAEQVKMNSQLAEIQDLKDTLGLISDMMVEVDEDPTKLSIEDLTAEDPDSERKRRAMEFLNK